LRAKASFTLPFTGLQVEGVPLNLLDDIFLLHFALKPPQRILERFTFLQPYFSHPARHPQTRPKWTGYLLQGSAGQVKQYVGFRADKMQARSQAWAFFSQ